MSGEERRMEIISLLKESRQPISGTALAQQFFVSRQVIVQDIALLRTANYDILSTNRGYLLKEAPYCGVERTFKCYHKDEQTEEELNLIVDQGGLVKNVFIHHKAYGRIEAELNIHSRRDVKQFMATIKSGKSTLLKNITSDYHYHQVFAENEDILDSIETELKQKGFLIEKESL